VSPDPQAGSPLLPVALLEWRSLVRGSLRGFAKIRIGKSLIVSDDRLHTSHGKCWASLPARPMLGSDSVALRDPDGRIRYVPILEWSCRDARDAFSTAVIEAVNRESPEAFEA
jgi:hypothetical protein